MNPAAQKDGSQPWTIARVLEWAARDFGERGLDSPRLDAEILLGHVLGLERLRLILDSARPLTADELSAYRGLIQRRRRCEPVAYIVGKREFYGIELEVDARVLIPRPDTEILVEVALERTRGREVFGRGLDLCTGSGCVSIALARARLAWKFVASDVSESALSVARRNAERNNVVHNVAFVESNLFASIRSPWPFDLVTANPPYIDQVGMTELAPDIARFEPRVALSGGDDGLDYVRAIAEQAPRHLATGGVLAVEVGFGQAERVEALFRAAGFVEVERTRDLAQVERVVSGVRPA